MSKIERRHKVVKLYRGNIEPELTALLDKAMAAHRAEAAEEAKEVEGPPRRIGQVPKSKALKKSIEYGIQYDKLLTDAEEAAVAVTVWAIGYDEWSQLNDAHPAREPIAANEETGVTAKAYLKDQERGVNVDTFPPLLLKAALVDPDVEVADLEDRIAKGTQILADLSPSRTDYVKLETAAWNVNVEGDAIPKAFSLVSFLTAASDDGSKPQRDSE